MKSSLLVGAALAIAAPASAADYTGYFYFTVTDGGRYFTNSDHQREFTSYVGSEGVLTWKTLTEFNVPSPGDPSKTVAALTRNTAHLGGIVEFTQTNDPFHDNGHSYVGASYNGDADAGSFNVFFNGNATIEQSVTFSFTNGLLNATGSGTGRYQIDFAAFYEPDTTQVKFQITGGRTFAIVPEPATWAMMIAGFGLLGSAARRRHDVAAVS